MKDHQNREVDNLRISVTQRCHYDCAYCHMEGESSPGTEMSLEKIRSIVQAAAKMGVSKVKITGGEPLLREDIVAIVKAIKEQKGIREVSMATTGLLLPKYAVALKQAGLDRVNIGCDTINTDASKKTTSSIKKGLAATKAAGFENTKINMLVLKGVNDHEIDDMISFAKEHEATLQLIELINTNQDYYDQHYYPLEAVEERLAKEASNITTRSMHARKQYHIEGTVIETVKPFKKDFCQHCTRLRVTSDGQLKPCLMREDNHVKHVDEKSIKEAIAVKEAYEE